jgi:hypothetical protein
MSFHTHLLDLVRHYMPPPSPSPATRACLACLSAAPPEDIPSGPGMEDLARAFIHAFFRKDPSGLPPGLAFHVADWLEFPADPAPFLKAWVSSGSIAEVAHRLGTDPDEVLHIADGLRKRGVGLPAAPGGQRSR